MIRIYFKQSDLSLFAFKQIDQYDCRADQNHNSY